MKLNSTRVRSIRGLLAAAAILLLASMTGLALAQSSEDAWSAPTNLSRSGATGDPQLVIDGTGRIHTLWSDNYVDGFVYSGWDGTAWSEPVSITPSFDIDLASLQLRPDSASFIHIFWIGEEGELFYSRVLSENFGQINLWSAPIQLGQQTVNFAVAVAPDDSLHAVYFHAGAESSSQAAGVYYVRRAPGANLWNTAVQLDQSSYYRDADLSSAIGVTTGANQQVYASWDNRSTAQVLFAQSLDGGVTWAPARVMDAREEADDPEAVSPGSIRIAAQDSQVMLIWKAGHTGELCETYFRWSNDGGLTWVDRDQIKNNFQGCWSDGLMFAAPDNHIYVLSESALGAQIVPWNGEAWGLSQFQPVLTSFAHPETYQVIDLGCLKAALDPSQMLYVIGCDATGARDVWLTSRSLDEKAEWYPDAPPPPVWEPELLIPLDDQPTNISMTADIDEYVHVMMGFAGRGALLYGRFDSARLFSSTGANLTTILSSPDGLAARPAIAMALNNDLLVTWTNGPTGVIQFAFTDQLKGLLEEEWPEPALLPAPRSAGSSPAMVVSPSGTIYVAYAIPVNEDRGIYLTQSTDNGVTWSIPILAFDAMSAGWDLVDEPKLTITNEGSLHILFRKYTRLPFEQTDLTPSGLFYIRSTDNGATWTVPEELAAQSVSEYEILGLPNGTLHRVWQEPTDDTITLWHSFSTDNGSTWSILNRIDTNTDLLTQVSLISDAANQVHLFELGNINYEGVVDLTLVQRTWTTDVWETVDRTVMQGDETYDLRAVALRSGKFVVVYAGRTINAATGELGGPALHLTSRTYELAEIEDPSILTPVATASPPPTPAPSPTPMPTPPLSFPTSPGEQPGAADGNLTGLVIGIGAAMVTIGLLFFIFTRMNQRRS